MKVPTYEQGVQLDRNWVELKAGLSHEAVQRAIESFDLVRAIAEGQFDLAALRSQVVYPVTVNYGQTLAEMIAIGRYDWVNNDITQEHFPITGESQAECKIQLVHLNRNASDEEVTAELERRDLRDATIEELLAFGAANPNIQRKFSIVARGSWFSRPDGRRLAPDLDAFAGRRRLYLVYLEYDWNDYWRFLAARK